MADVEKITDSDGVEHSIKDSVHFVESKDENGKIIRIGLLPTRQWHPDWTPEECLINWGGTGLTLAGSPLYIYGDPTFFMSEGSTEEDFATIVRRWVDPNDHSKGFNFGFEREALTQGIPGVVPTEAYTAILVPPCDDVYMEGGLWSDNTNSGPFSLILHNKTNLWIGAASSTKNHHPGQLLISTGYNASTGSPYSTIRVYKPTYNSETDDFTSVGYDVHHDGYRIKSSTLAGTGNRELYATSDGTIAARSGTMSKKLGTISVASGATTTVLTLTEELEKYKYVMFLLCYNTNGDIPYGQLIMPTANISLFNASTKTAEVSSLSSNSGGDYIRFYVTTTSGKTNKVTITAKSKVSANRYLAVFGLEEL